MSNEKYAVSVDRAKKMVKVTFNDTLECADAEKFFSMYGNATNGISKKDYNVIVDCKNMGIFKSEVLPYMKQGYLEYANYRHIHVIESDKTIVNMQFKRIGKELGLMNKMSITKDEDNIKFI